MDPPGNSGSYILRPALRTAKHSVRRNSAPHSLARVPRHTPADTLAARMARNDVASLIWTLFPRGLLFLGFCPAFDVSLGGAVNLNQGHFDRGLAVVLMGVRSIRLEPRMVPLGTACTNAFTVRQRDVPENPWLKLPVSS